MVYFEEGQNPTVPGNATLEPREIDAFKSGHPGVVREAGIQYGVACFNYGIEHPEETADVIAGVTAVAKVLSSEVPLSLTSFRMKLPFMEGIQAGVSTRRREIDEAIRWREENPRQFELYQGLEALRRLGQNPLAREIQERDSQATFDKIISTLREITGSQTPQAGGDKL